MLTAPDGLTINDEFSAGEVPMQRFFEIAVSLAEILEAAEGAGAAACAAAQKEDIRGRRTDVVLTGGNIDRDWFAAIISVRTPAPAD